ncbi:hypothetical protein BXZ70DRAFT_1011672 [Cristinia sonorae]|uniref:Uncharacterized protein n=1 Tax=Cristinia sonorae TaxID=1940300 RepID=A0A8K0XL90_9AGAR|nr:hypothetical protein BXZ70DRAFT_1011672 [Cristinia sonorae]
MFHKAKHHMLATELWEVLWIGSGGALDVLGTFVQQLVCVSSGDQSSPLFRASMGARRNLVINPFGDRYPDDDSAKLVMVQADGLEYAANGSDRHVLVYWLNGTDNHGERYMQLVHLTGGPGNYSFFSTSVQRQPPQTVTLYELGTFTRAQRDQIIALARAVRFDKRSYVNNCQTWLRDVLEAMVNADLISRALLEEIDAGIPLKTRVPELPADTSA